MLSWGGGCITLVSAMPPASDVAEIGGCTESESPVVEAASARWEEGEGGSYDVVADVPDNYTWELSLEVKLGALRFAWSEGPYETTPSQPLTVSLAPPSEAHMHALSDDYVTDLRVKLLGTNAQGHQVLLRPPDAYLAWPSGQLAGPVVWDEATMVLLAPLGITDDTLRVSIGEVEVERVLPPLYLTQRPALDPALDGEG